jgi:hypothetical protein
MNAFYAFPVKMILPADETRIRRGEVSMLPLGDETLIVYANHSGRGDNAVGEIYAQWLDNDGNPSGEEWKIIERPPGALNVMSPAIRLLPDGKIGMVYSNRLTLKEAQRVFVYSEDCGRTWSKPVVAGSGVYVTGCHDRLTVLSSGRLVAPLHCTQDWDWHYLKVRAAWSDDNGLNWNQSNTLSLPYVGRSFDWDGPVPESGCIEPGVAERADGSLLMCIRTAMGTQFYSESFDAGETWTSPKTLGLVSPVAPANLTRIPGTDDLLILWTSDFDVQQKHMGERHTIMAAVSHDGGKTWPYGARKPLLHDGEHSVDYPAVCYQKDEIWAAFRHSTQGEILGGKTSTALMRIPLSWIYKK